MSKQFFNLIPFGKKDLLPDIDVTGRISRKLNTISAIYEITGNLSQIDIPKHRAHPIRQLNLWKNTCLELFIGVKGAPQYWEFNLSPSGDWNVFEFRTYRNVAHHNRLDEVDVFSSFPFVKHLKYNELKIQVEFNMDGLIGRKDMLDVGIAAVMKSTENSNALTYLALGHTGRKPDFHCRDNFSIHL